MATVLTVDDDFDDLDLFEEAILEIDSETELVKANNGQEALSLLSTVIPDFIFLDINMPIMNGLECLKMIRKEARYKQTIITILSTYLDADAMVICSEMNAEFVCKPNNFHELKNILIRIFKIHSVRLS